MAIVDKKFLIYEMVDGGWILRYRRVKTKTLLGIKECVVYGSCFSDTPTLQLMQAFLEVCGYLTNLRKGQLPCLYLKKR